MMMLFEGIAEYALAGKAGVEADVFHGKFCGFQQVSGSGHAGIDQVFVGSKTGLLFEGAYEMVLA